MTVKIPLSEIRSMSPDFATQAARLAVEMKSWRAHMARVEDDEAKGVTGIDKHWPLKRPGSHPLVEKAVNEHDEICFEIVDDSPSPEQILAAKKNRLFSAVAQAEQAAIESVTPPPGKRRLLNLLEADVRTKDSALLNKLIEKRNSVLNAVATAAKIKKPVTDEDIAATVVAKRTSEDQKIIATQETARSRVNEIIRIAAQADSDIEDLTIETIDAWKIPDFNALKGWNIMQFLKTFTAAIVAGLLLLAPAIAQTSPGLTKGQVLTAGQWNNLFASKQDTLGYTPLNSAGGTMTGRLVMAASSGTDSSLNMPQGVTPASPVNGDMWVTSSGFFVQVNGVTIGPLAGAGAGTFTATSPIAVTFPSPGVVNYAFDFTVANTFLAQQTAQGASGTTPGWFVQLPGDTTPRVRLGLDGADVGSLQIGPGNAIRDTFLRRFAAASWQFGNADAAAPVAQTIGVQNVVAGTSNTAGATLMFNGSRGTGTGVGGNIVFQTAPAGSTGTSQNALASALTIFGTGGVATGAAADPGVGNLNLAGGSLLNNGTSPTGTGAYVRQTSSSLITPQLGVATATSLAIGGATIGTNGLAVNGTALITGTTQPQLTVSNASTDGSAVRVQGTTHQVQLGEIATGGELKTVSAGELIFGTNNVSRFHISSAGGLYGEGASGGDQGIGTFNLASPASIYANGVAPTGTGGYVRLASPTITGTLAVTGAANVNGTISAASTSASTFTAGAGGSNNPAFQVDASAASQVAGLKVTGAATGGTVALAAIDSGSNTNLSIDAKGTGTVTIAGTSTGAITLSRATTLSNALTYGGVTLANAVTGTGNMMLSASPTTTGTLTAASGNFSGTLNPVTFQINSVSVNTAVSTTQYAAVKIDNSTITVNGSGQLQASGAVASAIAVGTTSVTSGTNGNIEINNAGVLGEATPGNGLSISGGVLGLTSAWRTEPTTSTVTLTAHSAEFSANASGTFTTPANARRIRIIMVAGGGGGTGSGATAGASGNGGATCWNTSGAACTSAVLQASGGNGTSNSGQVAGGGGGAGSAGSTACNVFANTGQTGTGGDNLTTNGAGKSGGSSGLWPGGGGGPAGGGNAGTAGIADSGGGGAGASGAAVVGGAGGGGGGGCIHDIASPAATYTYAVGAAGTAGGAGTAGAAGGAGGGGKIIVQVFYGSS